jgi:serine/threonine protein kinase/tetratricopeptide (TPR) repeat protein
MRNDQDSVMDREQQLDNILVTYLEAVEAGRAPDRREWLARYPEFAEELRAFFADEERFDSLVSPLRPAAPGSIITPRAPSALPSTVVRLPVNGQAQAAPRADGARSFGDYELLGEIARGGMGVVFKARQVSLNRTVALKMIRDGHLAFTEEVQRFRLEAEEAANLDHPHIVPIYDIGEHQGRPYFSMKLIEGGSLAQRMDDFRFPSLDGPAGKDAQGRRWTRPELKQRQAQIAQMLAAVARAVDYAHLRGLLHRDLKPGNILVDLQGQPHVTDFGLAKRVRREAGEGAANPAPLTQSGIAVGTPNYMAPEQAAGPRTALTTAADVYSLGAILYELLTGRPPFKGESLLGTLVQVLEREPEPPRALAPAVHPDLETICLKCLHKDPTKRYASAAALAEDLERFQAGDPIQARPSGNFERLHRWCRRHPARATAVALTGLLVVAAVAVAFLWAASEARHVERLVKEQEQTKNALDEAQRQTRKADAANKRLAQEKTETQKALEESRHQTHKANAARTQADACFHLAHQAVGDFCVRLSQDRLNKVPGLEPLRKELLEGALTYYEDFIKQRGQDPSLRTELADTYFQVGRITNTISSQHKALAAYQKALAMYQELLRDQPGSVAPRAGIARTSLNMGMILDAVGKPREGLASLHHAREMLEELTKAFPNVPNYQSNLAASCTNLGILYRAQGRLDRALNFFQRALTLQDRLVRRYPKISRFRSELAIGHVNMGVIYGVLGRQKEALASYEKARSLQGEIVARNPNLPWVQRDLALNHRRIGTRLCEAGDTAAGLKALEQGHRISNLLARSNPNVTEFQTDLALSNRQLGHAYKNSGRPDKALPYYHTARAIMERLAGLYPKVWPIQGELALCYFHLARVQEDRNQKAESLAQLRRARAIQEDLVLADPTNLHYRTQLSDTLHDLGRALSRMNWLAQARATLRQAVEYQGAAAARAPQVVRYQRDRAAYLETLADVLRREGRPKAHLRCLLDSLAVREAVASIGPRAVGARRELAGSYRQLAEAFGGYRLLKQAYAWYDKARLLRDELARTHPRDLVLQRDLGTFYFQRALFHYHLKQTEKEVEFYQKSRTIRLKLVEARPKDVSLRSDLCATLNNLGLTLGHAGRYDDGAAVLRQAVEHERVTVALAPRDVRYRQSLDNHYRGLAWALRHGKRPAEAAAVTRERQKLWPDNPREQFLAAREFAMAAQVVGEGKNELSPAERKERDRCCELAVAALRQAVDHGFNNIDQLRKTSEFALLREREDYKGVLAKLKK